MSGSRDPAQAAAPPLDRPGRAGRGRRQVYSRSRSFARSLLIYFSSLQQSHRRTESNVFLRCGDYRFGHSDQCHRPEAAVVRGEVVMVTGLLDETMRSPWAG
jgi:hypothetical protein